MDKTDSGSRYHYGNDWNESYGGFNSYTYPNTNFDNQDPPLPLGTTFNITTGEPGSGTITITLIHLPQ